MNRAVVVGTPLRCSQISDRVTTTNGEVTEKRTVRLENDVFSITLKGQPDKLPFIEGEAYGAEFRNADTDAPAILAGTVDSEPREVKRHGR
ncbi:MAG: hypothetical protein JW945_02040 [Methanomicrobia archaeon]|nr:hypothetical protein [Methanomicrobia archaeon]